MLSSAVVKSLSSPTETQIEAFVQHLIQVPSWYKHLPLFEGGDFVVFLAPDAGEDYPTQHPRLPTENTLAGYRQAFGHLDYIYRCRPTEPFSRDGPKAPDLSSRFFDTGRFKLFPYVSYEFYWSVHENDVALIRSGAYHPHAAAIVDAYNAAQIMDQEWEKLSDDESNIVVKIDDSSPTFDPEKLSKAVLQYLELEKTTWQTYCKLQEPEALKIRYHVTAFLQSLA
jgi:hypothetical protein